MSAAFVDINDVCVEYGSGVSAVRALDHARLVFGRGDFICIVGPSGCGKTTLFRRWLDLLSPPAVKSTWRAPRLLDPVPIVAWCFSSRHCSHG